MDLLGDDAFEEVVGREAVVVLDVGGGVAGAGHEVAVVAVGQFERGDGAAGAAEWRQARTHRLAGGGGRGDVQRGRHEFALGEVELPLEIVAVVVGPWRDRRRGRGRRHAVWRALHAAVRGGWEVGGVEAWESGQFEGVGRGRSPFPAGGPRVHVSW